MMFKSPFMMLTTSTMLMSTLMVISSSNWIMLWLAMELNLLTFIPIIFSSHQYQETEAMVKYFLVQALGSSLLIMSSMSMYLMNINSVYMYTLLLISMMIKIGLAPCHWWYPSVMTSISWVSALILSSWQKIAPLSIMMFILSKSSTTLSILASMNALIGGLMGMNQVHIRTIMAYSSITHLGWMVALMSMNLITPSLIYFITYTLMIIPIFLYFNKMNMNTVAQSTSMSKLSSMMLVFTLTILSLGGLPPLMGFFPKLMVMMLSNNPIMLLMLIMGSLMNLYYYLNIVFAMMLKSPQHNNMSHMSSTMILMTYVTLSFLLVTPLLLM